MDPLPFSALLDGDTDERTAAARRLREVAATSPECLSGSLGRLSEAATDEHEPVRRHVQAALAAVAAERPATVEPAAETLVDGLDDGSAAVREEAARAVADLAAARPQRVRFAVDALVAMLTDTKPVRRACARALAALAPRYPEVLHEHLDPLIRALLDGYYPVLAATLRALTHLERTYPGALDTTQQRLRDLLSATAAAVRQAACRAVAANHPDWARRALQRRCQEEPNPLVRETARAALTELDAAEGPPATPEGSATAVLEAATLGAWVTVGTDDGTTFVGRVSAVTHDESEADVKRRRAHGLRRRDFEDREAWLGAPRVRPSGERSAVHLHDPFREHGLTLLPVTGGVGAEHTGPDREVPALHHPTAVRTVPSDLARLLAAAPGDELAFQLEGADHAVTVRSAGDDGDGVYRVVGRNDDRGYEITFRPRSQSPLMAVFEKGRAFRAENVRLAAAD